MKAGYKRERILIWAKTYPELSSKYIETVCTAGVLESGQPVRLYPIKYRYLNGDRDKFSLYQWITADICKNPNDSRPESCKVDCDSLQVGETVPTTADEWGKRAHFIFRDSRWQFDTVDDLLAAQRTQKTSFGIVAPRAVTKVEALERPQTDFENFEQKFQDLRKRLAAQRAQIDMFEQSIPSEMKRLDFLKLRVVVSWLCNAEKCNGHNMQVLDWGLCELQRKRGSEAAVAKMRELCDLQTYNLKFFLGNLFLHPSNFLVVGLWYPKRSNRLF